MTEGFISSTTKALGRSALGSPLPLEEELTRVFVLWVLSTGVGWEHTENAFSPLDFDSSRSYIRG